MAAINDNIVLIGLLVYAGASVNAVTQEGETPADTAQRFGKPNAALYLSQFRLMAEKRGVKRKQPDPPTIDNNDKDNDKDEDKDEEDNSNAGLKLD